MSFFYNSSWFVYLALKQLCFLCYRFYRIQEIGTTMQESMPSHCEVCKEVYHPTNHEEIENYVTRSSRRMKRQAAPFHLASDPTTREKLGGPSIYARWFRALTKRFNREVNHQALLFKKEVWAKCTRKVNPLAASETLPPPHSALLCFDSFPGKREGLETSVRAEPEPKNIQWPQSYLFI